MSTSKIEEINQQITKLEQDKQKLEAASKKDARSKMSAQDKRLVQGLKKEVREICVATTFQIPLEITLQLDVVPYLWEDGSDEPYDINCIAFVCKKKLFGEISELQYEDFVLNKLKPFSQKVSKIKKSLAKLEKKYPGITKEIVNQL